MASRKFKKLPKRAQRAAFANMDRERKRKKSRQSFKGRSLLSTPGGRAKIQSLDRYLTAGTKKPKTSRQRKIAGLDRYLRS